MNQVSPKVGVKIDSIDVSAFTIPTNAPESDGTFEWSSTTVVAVEASAAGKRGLGVTYAGTSSAYLIRDKLADVVTGRDAMNVGASFDAMVQAVRNLGRSGVASTAISAVDLALWDLKARLLDLPLCVLLGMVRSSVPLYGSGGFTSYAPDPLVAQLGGWAEQGFGMVKMKIGRDPAVDPERVRLAREAIGNGVELFVDANGAYSRKQALTLAEVFDEQRISWFEEPVSSDDLDGLRLMRDRAPARIRIAAGEYGYDIFYFRRMLEHGAVDVLQADATRCGGVTGFLKAAVLCDARSMPLSAHCGPAMHLHVCCAAPRLENIEYFHDHARIDGLLFDGAPEPRDGNLTPDLTRTGMGLELKWPDAEQWQVRL